MVTKVLEPTIGSYFRTSAQGHDALDFHNQRVKRQLEAMGRIKNALSRHGVEGRDTLINEIDLPDKLERILNERRIIEEEQEKEKERQDLELYRAKHEVNLSHIKVEAEARTTIRSGC